jgi:hypothetical protein
VNGSAPTNIQVVKPFSDAIELTKQILFRPFDLKKWLLIGFCAWLANLGGGGGSGGNFRAGGYNQPSELRNNPAFRGITDFVHQTPQWAIVAIIACFVVLVLALVILFAWLRARGVFMFVDCIVRNRGAVKEPWREFRKIGNSFFLFTLLVALAFLLLAAALAIPFILVSIYGGPSHELSVPGVIGLALWACAIFILAIAWALISQLMVPIMYRRRCLAREGFRVTISLISQNPGEITLYCLFWILLIIGVIIVSCLAVCLTCCLVAIPYVGTVILLPVFLCLRAFTLLYLRQFGADYDVWTGLPPAASEIPAPPPAPVSPPEPPPPQLPPPVPPAEPRSPPPAQA